MPTTCSALTWPERHQQHHVCHRAVHAKEEIAQQTGTKMLSIKGLWEVLLGKRYTGNATLETQHHKAACPVHAYLFANCNMSVTGKAVHATEELAQQAGTAAARSTAHAADWAAEKVHDGASAAGRGIGRAAGKTAAVAERTVTAAEETVGAVVGAPAALGRAVASAAHRVVDDIEDAADSVVGAVKGNIQAASDKVTDAEDAVTNKVSDRHSQHSTCLNISDLQCSSFMAKGV